MNQRASALWVRLKANRLAYTLTILLTLTVGILIGTVISYGVKGQDKKTSSSDAAMLTVPSPQLLSNQFSQISKQLEPQRGQHQHRIHHQDAQRRRRGSPNGDDDANPFDDFFDRFFGGQGGQGGQGGAGRRFDSRALAGFRRDCRSQGLHRHQPPRGGEGRPDSGEAAGRSAGRAA